jgi:Tfp pilus assembly protein PilF
MKIETRSLPFGRSVRLRIPVVTFAIAFLLLWSLPVQSEQTNAPVMDPQVRQAFEQGLADFQAGRFVEAKQSFTRVTALLRKAVHLDPDVTQSWLTLGIIAFRKGELDASLAALSQAVYLEPDNSHAHMYLGVLARKRGWLDAAEDELRKAVELDDSYAEAHFNLALVYMERRPPEIELARRHYYRARALGAAADADLDRLLKQSPVSP